MYCSKCGKKADDSKVFCPYCGEKMKTSTTEFGKKEPEHAIKSMVYLRNLAIIMGIILCISGFACGKISDSYKPMDFMTGAIIDGEMVIHNTYEEALGGNTEGVETFRKLSIGCYILAVSCFLGAIMCSKGKTHIQNAEKTVRIGRILEKKENMVTIEFENGERKYFSVEPGVIVTIGDVGKMTLHGNFLIAFEKMR